MKTYEALVEGKRIPIPAEIGEDDAAVAKVLAPYYPDIADGAELDREEKDGVVTITVTPRAKSKGTGAAAAR
jgi:hypothetical protein